MTAKKKIKNPVIRKKGKWFNRITNRFVSESTAKRYNNFYKKNPKSPHSRAYGNYGFNSKKKYSKQGLKLQRLIQKNNQIIKTRNRKGETVFYSPFEKKEVGKKDIDQIKELDYSLLSGAIKVRLYRLTKDGNNIYHVWSFPVKMNFQLPKQLEVWLNYEAVNIVKKIMDDVYKQSKLNSLGKNQNCYGYLDARYHSEIDSYKAGTTFGFARPTREGLNLVQKEFKNIVLSRMRRLSTMSYHLVRFNSLNVYLWNHASQSNIKYGTYRKGVIGLDYYK